MFLPAIVFLLLKLTVQTITVLAISESGRLNESQSLFSVSDRKKNNNVCLANEK